MQVGKFPETARSNGAGRPMKRSLVDSNQSALIIYDGECVFCQNYVRLLRLREGVGAVELVDARSSDPRVVSLQRQGYDLDDGMVFIHNGRIYHGHDAVHALALLTSDSTLFNKLTARVLSRPNIAAAIYPVLKAGRRITLFVRGRKMIADDPKSSAPDALGDVR